MVQTGTNQAKDRILSCVLTADPALIAIVRLSSS
jgi:hypothetical protein